MTFVPDVVFIICRCVAVVALAEIARWSRGGCGDWLAWCLCGLFWLCCHVIWICVCMCSCALWFWLYIDHAGFADGGNALDILLLLFELTNLFCRRDTLGCAGLTIFCRLLQALESWIGRNQRYAKWFSWCRYTERRRTMDGGDSVNFVCRRRIHGKTRQFHRLKNENWYKLMWKPRGMVWMKNRNRVLVFENANVKLWTSWNVFGMPGML